MNALSTLTILPRTEQEITNYIDSVKSEMLAGYMTGQEILILIKALDKIVSALKKDEEINTYVNDEMDKYVEKTIKYLGNQITKRTSVKYDYSTCNDSKWNELKDKETQIKSEIKGREMWLKSLKESKPDQDTGELIFPAAKTTTDSYVITFKK